LQPIPAPWYRILLSRGEYEAGESDLVRAVFQETFIARNGPAGAALFGGWAEDGKSFLLYFTPSARACARALFQAYCAEPCGPPAMLSVNWMAGDQGRVSGQGFEF